MNNTTLNTDGFSRFKTILIGTLVIAVIVFGSTYFLKPELFKGDITSECGDGIKEGNEECDDGNTKSGDGCSKKCLSEICGNGRKDYGEQCDDGNLENYDGCSARCQKEKKVKAVCGNGIREGKEECDDGNKKNSDGCSSKCKEEICGNDRIDYRSDGSGIKEECDDGNLDNGDGCNDRCQKEKCGNYRIDANESCDDGNTKSGDGCSSKCKLERCGNNIKDTGEECDDGNLKAGDGCSPDCKKEVCGNGILDPGEECDDGNKKGGDGCSAKCTFEVCGNGIKEKGEECDDGNKIGGDGCSPDCKKEVCGNGVLDAGEECDDGNKKSGDGCDKTCHRERLAKSLDQYSPKNLKKHISVCFNTSLKGMDFSDDPDNDNTAIETEIKNTDHPFIGGTPLFADTKEIPSETYLAQKEIRIPYRNKDNQSIHTILRPSEGNFAGWYLFFGCIKGRVPKEHLALSDEELKSQNISREFKPFERITRAEAVKVILEGFNIKIPSQTKRDPFKDVSRNDWYATYIEVVSKAKIVSGYEGKIFKPNDFISRAAALKIILSVVALNPDSANLRFIQDIIDVPTNNWYAPYIALAIENGVVEDDIINFKPNEPITRYDLVKYTVLAWIATQNPETFFVDGN